MTLNPNRRRAQEADRCFECKRVLSPDEAVYRVLRIRCLMLVWVCCDCVRANHVELLDCDIPPPDACLVCNRELYILEEVPISDWTNVRGQHFHEEGKPHDHDRFRLYCSDRCRLKTIAKKRRDARHEGLAERQCERCHKAIKLDDRRTDARFCNATCRSRGLRKKRLDEIPRELRKQLAKESMQRYLEERAALKVAEQRREQGLPWTNEIVEEQARKREEARREVREKYPQLRFRH